MNEEIWQESVGYVPFKVDVLEMPRRKRVLYLRWRLDNNWKYESLRRTLYDAKGKRLRGRALEDVKREAIDRAKVKHQELISGLPTNVVEPQRQLAIGEAWDLVSNKEKGLYPVDSPHRREVKRALDDAIRIWGARKPWNAIDRDEITALGRRRIDELAKSPRAKAGHRGAEVTIARVLTVATWLRDRGHINPAAAVPTSTWKDDLRTYWSQARGQAGAPPVHRPRYTLPEMRQLLAVSPQVDPRFKLLLELGAGLRLGQVVRSKRSHLDLDAGVLMVQGAGKKRAPRERLTAGQLMAAREALDSGYLHELETARVQGTIADYPLFPSGQLPGSKPHLWRAKGKRARVSRGPETPTAEVDRHATAAPLTMGPVRKWVRKAEELAEPKIANVKGRAGTGIRRIVVDEAKKRKISREGLMAIGGWSDSQVPDSIYADQERQYAELEARDVRASIRGEAPAEETLETPNGVRQ